MVEALVMGKVTRSENGWEMRTRVEDLVLVAADVSLQFIWFEKRSIVSSLKKRDITSSVGSESVNRT